MNVMKKIILAGISVYYVLWLIGTIPDFLGIGIILTLVIAIVFIAMALAGGAGKDIARIHEKEKFSNKMDTLIGELRRNK